ncbi:zf-HC2 domain-containing protein [Streptomyces sp. ISL-96]|uniref:anti-sigma factor family protein n=1 Tax=Streptomyces sp. ISL-96 TaxID=2819191 RepID=UPI001BE925F0|nr:zf-HC2 domain-containing protein [Streptomyces sp. ISL-96]MBT2489265.1 zf-HC2 domain-containing protein [Streptomyces sp. ISL-96]
MSGTRPTSAEQHLGDRLAALVDGELSHDVRERVLSHLATCAKCKAEADEQRRLKSVFSTTAPPPPSEGLLARLQGLPGGGPGGDDSDGPRPFGQGGFGNGVFGPDTPRTRPGRPGNNFDFEYAPAAGHAGVLPGAAPGRGFRIHDVGRAETERSGGRGRRLAFAAASAVSLAAFALGGAMPVGSAGEPTARSGGSGNNVTPQRAPSPSGVVAENNRRRATGNNLLAASASAGTNVGTHAGTDATAPSRLFGAGTGQGGAQGHALTQPFSAPALTGQTPLPLIRRSGSALALAYYPGHRPSVTVPPSLSPLQLATPSQPGLPVSP